MNTISAAEATEIIYSKAKSYGVESVSIENCLGRILAQDIVADRDFPPFDRVTMDGICIRRKDFEAGTKAFTIKTTIAAGARTNVEIGAGECVEIMTGASLPKSTTHLQVVRYEDTQIEGDMATVTLSDLPEKNNVHKKGEDKKQGAVLIKDGAEIRAAELNVLATVGAASVSVYKLPKVAVVSTGNELVAVADTPLPYQIRKSNVYGIDAFLSPYSDHIDQVHLEDERSIIHSKLADILKKYDIVVLSGGVSKGKFDFIPEVLESLGVEKSFHGVMQRPGKPFWFGTSDSCAVFALPGNPVSAMAGTCRYVIPFIKKSIKQLPLQYHTAILATDITFKPKLTRYMEANVRSGDDGKLIASAVFGNGSGDFTRLLEANAFIELPADETNFVVGDVVRFFYM